MFAKWQEGARGRAANRSAHCAHWPRASHGPRWSMDRRSRVRAALLDSVRHVGPQASLGVARTRRRRIQRRTGVVVCAHRWPIYRLAVARHAGRIPGAHRTGQEAADDGSVRSRDGPDDHRRRELGRPFLLHPGLMYKLFLPFWKEQLTVRRVDNYSHYHTITPPAVSALAGRLPSSLRCGPVLFQFVLSRYRRQPRVRGIHRALACGHDRCRAAQHRHSRRRSSGLHARAREPDPYRGRPDDARAQSRHPDRRHRRRPGICRHPHYRYLLPAHGGFLPSSRPPSTSNVTQLRQLLQDRGRAPREARLLRGYLHQAAGNTPGVHAVAGRCAGAFRPSTSRRSDRQRVVAVVRTRPAADHAASCAGLSATDACRAQARGAQPAPSGRE